MGSDHDVYQDSLFGIPAIYLNDWPDRYIHTNFDSADNIDPTKLKRAAFIGAASGYFLVRLRASDYQPLLQVIKTNQYDRVAETRRRASQLSQDNDNAILFKNYAQYETRLAESIGALLSVSLTGNETRLPIDKFDRLAAKSGAQNRTPEQNIIWKRRLLPKGPLAVFGYDYFSDHATATG